MPCWCPSFVHLADYPDPRISSKATLLIGKRIQDGHWAGQQWQRQEDPRVRANSIESIWGIDSPECRALLWSVVEDKKLPSRRQRLVRPASVA